MFIMLHSSANISLPHNHLRGGEFTKLKQIFMQRFDTFVNYEVNAKQANLVNANFLSIVLLLAHAVQWQNAA